jgi:hypothetical protein
LDLPDVGVADLLVLGGTDLPGWAVFGVFGVVTAPIFLALAEKGT